MPTRVALKRLSELERYICPFLAPRAFAQWPTNLGRQRQFSTAVVEESNSSDVSRLSRPHPGELILKPPPRATGEPQELNSFSISQVQGEPFQGNRRPLRRLWRKAPGPTQSLVLKAEPRPKREYAVYLNVRRGSKEWWKGVRRGHALSRIKRPRLNGLEGKYLERMLESLRYIPREALAESSWDYSFQILEATVTRQRHRAWRNVKMTVNSEVAEWVEKWVHENNNIEQGWLEVPDAKRASYWQQIMLWLLRYRINYGLRFLRTTHTEDWIPPAERVSDSLDFIAGRYIDRVENPDNGTTHSLFVTILALMNARQKPLQLRQRTIFLLLSCLGIHRSARLHASSFAHGVWMHPHTLLHSIRIFAENNDFDWSLYILDRIVLMRRIDLSAPQYMATWATLLKACKKAADPDAATSAIIKRMIGNGVEPNTCHYNILMMNAIAKRDTAAAWRTFEEMKILGIPSSNHTYCILFYDARRNGDMITMNKVIEVARAENWLYGNIHLATIHLHAISTYDRTCTYYWQLLDLYASYFDIKPLQELGIADPNFPRPDAGTRMRPNRNVLSIMVVAALGMRRVRFFNKGKDKVDRILHFYKRYRALLKAGTNKSISELAMTDHVQHAFLYALGRHEKALQLLPGLIQDMFIPNAPGEECPESLPSTGVSREEDSPWEVPLEEGNPEDMPLNGDLPEPPSIRSPPNPRQLRHAPPNVQTFSILLHAYVRHGHIKAAERVLKLMHSHKLSPHIVTWNSLISGYSGMQYVNSVADAMERMEKDGWSLDEWTLKALSRVVDRSKLLKALEGKGASAGGERIGEEKLKSGVVSYFYV